MTPQEKAKDLVEKFKKYSYYPKTDDDEIFINQLSKNAKQCALIAVDELIEHGNYDNEWYWQEVKEELKQSK